MHIHNPYIFGRPIQETNKFFGRESLFFFIEDNLRNNEKFILLHGHRRIGKTSILKQIPHKIYLDDFAFVHFDLQHHSSSNLGNILYNLAQDIVDQIQLNERNIKIPQQTELDNNSDIFSSNFLPQIYQELGNKKIVLLLDEFDVLADDNSNILNKGMNFFPYLEKLQKQQSKLFIIAVSGRAPNDFKNLLQLFGSSPYQEIEFLDEPSAKRLISQPTQDILKYNQDAIAAILELTAGHPYCIQAICFNIFLQAKINNNSQVSPRDVENVIEKTIEQAEGGLSWIWDGLNIQQKVVLSAVVEAQKNAFHKGQRKPEEPLTVLKNYGVIQTEELVEAPSQLANKGFLDKTETRVKIEFVRRWLAQRHPLRQEIRELDKFEDTEVNSLCKVAAQQHQKGGKQNALNIYNQALLLNPNHFSTLLIIADLNLELKKFDEALQLYERAYKVDSINNKEALLTALETYGSELTKQRHYTQAKVQYNRVLAIQPDRRSALQRLEEIAGFESPKNTSQDRLQGISLSAIAAVIGIIALVGFGGIGIYKWLTPCAVGQQKVNGIFCQANTELENNITNKISRGERTLFPTITNPYRDQGIVFFKQGKYEKAANYFAQAVQYNHNDPEVLIYYNNALARKQSSPFTFAVVVPVEKLQSTAREMLRGVALAQKDFNFNGGLSSRLLEIVIADDADEREQAKKVAHQLVNDKNDKSVLAVIGHYTSEVTGKALYEYQTAEEPLAIISPTAASSQLQNDIFFRATPSTDKFAQQLAKYIRKHLRLTKVVIFFSRDGLFSRTLREEFTDKFKQLGGQVVWNPINLTDPKPNLDQKLEDSVSKYQAQAALLIPDPTDTPTARQIAITKANSNNPKVRNLQMIGSATLYSDTTLKDGGKAIEGLILTVPWFREARQSKNFARKAAQQWGGEISYRTATSYDATQALIQALSPNPSRATVLQRLREVNLSAQQTSGNKLKFTQGEIETEPTLIQVKGGKFENLEVEGESK